MTEPRTILITGATHRLVTGTGIANTTGRFFDRTRDTQANPQAYDIAARNELWKRSLQLVEHADVE